MTQDRDRRDDQSQEGEMNLNAEQVLGLSAASQSVEAQSQKEDVPTVWKIFGGAIVSIIFMLIVTIFGYIINNVNSIQTNINNLNADMVKKSEFNERVTNIWGTLRDVNSLKDRMNLVEQRNTNIDSLRERTTSVDARVTSLEAQVKTLQEENRSQAKDIQALRERVAVLEAAAKK